MISDLNGELITRSFYEKELQKTNSMSNGKDRIIYLIVGLIKKSLHQN